MCNVNHILRLFLPKCLLMAQKLLHQNITKKRTQPKGKQVIYYYFHSKKAGNIQQLVTFTYKHSLTVSNK